MKARNHFPGCCCTCAAPLGAGDVCATVRYCTRCARVVRMLAAALGIDGARRWLERPLKVLDGEMPATRINADFDLVGRVAFDVVRKAARA